MKETYKRTQKDEAQWLEQVRREHTLSSDIIRQLRNERQFLLANQQRLLTSLLQSDEVIHGYRTQVLADTERLLKSDAISGFYWDDVDGWHRNGDKGTSNGH